METEVQRLAKSAAVVFLGGGKEVSRRFLSDLEPGRTYLISHPTAEVLTFLVQNASLALYQIFIGVVSAHLFYRLIQQRNEGKTQEKLEARIKGILEEHAEHIDSKLRDLQEALGQSQERPEWVEKQLSIYMEKAQLLKRRDDVMRQIAGLVDEVFRQASEEEQ